ncbi:MAG: ABC-2 transporter permease [Paludibacteraceae bacterium]|nr:ABC-2 transporter permease [Paludibacteraceae bacterium]
MYKKELTYYFATPIAYIVLALFVLGISLFLWVIPGEWNIIDSGYANADGLFAIAPWLLILVCPALTMRLFAEERQSGTWDVLRSLPTTISRIVWAKYAAALTVMVVALLPCVVHLFIVYAIAEPVGNVDTGAFAGSMVGLLLLAADMLGVSLLCAACTTNQIVAFIVGAVANFALYWLLMQEHYQSLARGVIDAKDVFFFACMAIASVLLTIPIIRQLTRL